MTSGAVADRVVAVVVSLVILLPRFHPSTYSSRNLWLKTTDFLFINQIDIKSFFVEINIDSLIVYKSPPEVVVRVIEKVAVLVKDVAHY